MAPSIGLVVTEHAAGGVVEDGRVVGEIRKGMAQDALRATPAEELVKALAAGQTAEAIGLAFPGIVRAGDRGFAESSAAQRTGDRGGDG
jgi:hypothetical protein